METNCVVQELSVIPDGVIVNLTGHVVKFRDQTTRKYISIHPALIVDKDTRCSARIMRCDMKKMPSCKSDPTSIKKYYILPHMMAFDKKMMKRDDILTSNYRRKDGYASGLFKIVGTCDSVKDRWLMLRFK